MGYHNAGYDIVGVDNVSQPNFPFEFVQADAMTYPLDGFDAIHASPPCQAYSWAAKRWGKVWPDLIEPIRMRLAGHRYVIENVVGAPLINPIRLCGLMFGLGVLRHRLFESSVQLVEPDHVKHLPPYYRPARDGTQRLVKRSRYATVAGQGGESDSFKLSDWKKAMGISWMTKKELTEAIPPAYTEYVGRILYAA